MIIRAILYDGDFSDLRIKDFDSIDRTLAGFGKIAYISAQRGYTTNQIELDELAKDLCDYTIVTNDLFVWGDDKAWWSDRIDRCQAYILRQNSSTGTWNMSNIQSLTEKELRRPHNIVKMYIAGSFTEN